MSVRHAIETAVVLATASLLCLGAAPGSEGSGGRLPVPAALRPDAGSDCYRGAPSPWDAFTPEWARADGVGAGETVAAGETADGTSPPSYYAVELIPTKRVRGARMASGTAEVRFPRTPFGVALSEDGEYVYELDVRVREIRYREGSEFVVWVTTPDLDPVERIGVLDGTGTVSGRVAWNKFLVVVTMESEEDRSADRWRGPVVLRGMSRSGRMHTLAGHGPFQGEPCAKYGY